MATLINLNTARRCRAIAEFCGADDAARGIRRFPNPRDPKLRRLPFFHAYRRAFYRAMLAREPIN